MPAARRRFLKVKQNGYPPSMIFQTHRHPPPAEKALPSHFPGKRTKKMRLDWKVAGEERRGGDSSKRVSSASRSVHPTVARWSVHLLTLKCPSSLPSLLFRRAVRLLLRNEFASPLPQLASHPVQGSFSSPYSLFLLSPAHFPRFRLPARRRRRRDQTRRLQSPILLPKVAKSSSSAYEERERESFAFR